MSNPWEHINLSDYENHMKLEEVQQLQTLNLMMNEQFYKYSVQDIMILGISGGNGLEHINTQIIKNVFGIDINKDYLKECEKRYPHLKRILKLIYADLTTDCLLPYADLVVANLFIEYIGYSNFKKAINTIRPKYVSCGIQVNMDSTFVSNSPYIHVFNNLDSIHYEIDEKSLIESMNSINYNLIFKDGKTLPNGKKILRLDFNLKENIE